MDTTADPTTAMEAAGYVLDDPALGLDATVRRDFLSAALEMARAALGNQLIDPATYTLVRLVAGAVVLAFLVAKGSGGGVSRVLRSGTWIGAAALWLALRNVRR